MPDTEPKCLLLAQLRELEDKARSTQTLLDESKSYTALSTAAPHLFAIAESVGTMVLTDKASSEKHAKDLVGMWYEMRRCVEAAQHDGLYPTKPRKKKEDKQEIVDA